MTKIWDMTEKKTVYNVNQALDDIKKSHSPYQLNPYESREASLDLAFSSLMQRSFQLDLAAEDMNLRFVSIKIILAKNQDITYQTQKAMHMHDGYFSLILPFMDDTGIGLVFGEHYQWVQIEKIKLLNQISVASDDMTKHLVFSEITNHGPVLECHSTSGLVMIKPLTLNQTIPYYYHIVFRPLVSNPA
jgi:hypothetical protein